MAPAEPGPQDQVGLGVEDEGVHVQHGDVAPDEADVQLVLLATFGSMSDG
jgi:hypothetical protein